MARSSHLRIISAIFVLVALAATSQAACNFGASCSGISYGGSTMTATCKSVSGQNVRTSIDLNACISNNGGTLNCGNGYFRSCSGIQYSGTSVTATCSQVNGNPTTSQLDINRCVANNNGNLQCCSSK